ncbi:bifunctional RNase H/acid phosphatase [Corynebacterium sp. LK2522]|uniref:bifunctional RNase H/acid phosphatase n=1 Tax=Corynebacterium sp. LK2522 TaxID=3110474 RepID=UPI0034CF24CA
MKVIIYADGGSRGNPGVAGSGTVVYAADGREVLRTIAYVVGTQSTNNVAEYNGLLRGLEAAQELGASEIEFYMDSKLVVEQMNGRWKIKHPDMQKLAMQAHKLVAGLEDFQLAWVPRAKNKVADALSNDAMDAAAAGHVVGIVGGSGDGAEDGIKGGIEGDASTDDDAAGTTEHGGPAPRDWLGERGETTRLVLLRHGQTKMSALRQYSGHSNPPLTELGRRQALAAAQALASRFGTGEDCQVSAVVASPLGRCQETARAVGEVLGLDVDTDDGLIELDFGAWEKLTFSEAHERDPQLHAKWLKDTAVATPGGESLQQLHRRVRQAREKLVKRYAGKTIVLVSHVNPIKSLVAQGLGGGPSLFERFFLDLASLSEAEFWDDGALVRCVNDAGHLAGLGAEHS